MPLGAPAAVLVGALLMVLSGVLSQDEAYAILGERSHLQTICLLMGTMLLGHFFRRERLLFLDTLFPCGLSTLGLLSRVAALTSVVAALFTNDAACVMLTPALLRHWIQMRRPHSELKVLLLAIATSSNIGSVATVFGNPQMALIAAKTDSPLYEESRLDLRTCLLHLGPPALVCSFFNVLGLWLYHAIFLKNRNESFDTDAIEDEEKNGPEVKLKSCVAFRVAVVIVLISVVTLLVVSSPSHKFDLGLVPVAGGAILVFLDALLNRNEGSATLSNVDLNILLMFFGFFVWLKGFNKTNLPNYVWQKLGLASDSLDSIKSLSLLYAFILIGSNVFSNVPLTILVLDQLPPCVPNLPLVLYLGWVATIAGNLTLFGSVANLIVVEKAYETLRIKFTFFDYLKYGFFSTLILSIAGMCAIYLFLLL
ncbi:putative transporter arsB isoform X2 [Neocloeon triangulifer]|nr:putative transporter arsB isoform X2 [Neocloeon triangulifer]XP_059469229.1 putative transporter arsB isoform X2 [Neocloeon triangulifer]